MTRPPAIEVRGAGLVYPGPPPFTALDGASMAVGEGELVAIIGRSGAGKSSLLSVLGLLERPTLGTVLLHGTDTRTLSERARSHHRGQHLGYVFQDHQVMPYLTVTENLDVSMRYRGVRRRDRAVEASRVLAFVGLDHKRFAKGRQLSGGERQRVSIARALVGQPSVLLCDEPTGNLDRANGEAIVALLRTAADGGAAVVVVTHDPDVAAAADRTVTIEDGVLTS